MQTLFGFPSDTVRHKITRAHGAFRKFLDLECDRERRSAATVANVRNVAATDTEAIREDGLGDTPRAEVELKLCHAFTLPSGA